MSTYLPGFSGLINVEQIARIVPSAIGVHLYMLDGKEHVSMTADFHETMAAVYRCLEINF